MEFEFRPRPGIRLLWRVHPRDRVDAGTFVDSLGSVYAVIADAVTIFCAQRSAVVALERGGHGWHEITTDGGDVLAFGWTSAVCDFGCHDCGRDTWDETYQLTDRSWAQAGGVTGRLCIGCLEHRIGRRLDAHDFGDDDFDTAHGPVSDRLRQRRLTTTAAPNVSDDAPVGCVDLQAFDVHGDSYDIIACRHCQPWRAEVVRDVETGDVLVREWHAMECEAFRDLIGSPSTS